MTDSSQIIKISMKLECSHPHYATCHVKHGEGSTHSDGAVFKVSAPHEVSGIQTMLGSLYLWFKPYF